MPIAWFTAHGGLTRANGQRFRDLILSRGHTLDYGPMFRAFYGKDPDIGPMLEHRGLKTELALGLLFPPRLVQQRLGIAGWAVPCP